MIDEVLRHAKILTICSFVWITSNQQLIEFYASSGARSFSHYPSLFADAFIFYHMPVINNTSHLHANATVLFVLLNAISKLLSLLTLKTV